MEAFKGENDNKTLMIVGVLILVAIVGYFIWKRMKAQKQVTSGSNSNSGANVPVGDGVKSTVKHTTSSSTTKFPIKEGSTGETVKAIQQYLLDNNYKDGSGNPIIVDKGIGVFGPKTKAAWDRTGLPYPITKDVLDGLGSKISVHDSASSADSGKSTWSLIGDYASDLVHFKVPSPELGNRIVDGTKKILIGG